MNKLMAGVIVGLLMAASAFAADIDGKWTGSMSTPGGDFEQSFNLKAEGAKLTGTMQGFDGSTIKIEDGKIDGNKFSFSATIDFSGMSIMLNYTGTVEKDQMKMTMEAMGMPIDLVLKKSTT